ncbi:MAG: phosphodiesterase [Pseudomonadota bacterium]
MSTQRLLQLSDCHLMANREETLRGFNPHESLRKLLEQIKKKDRRFDALLLSGDLSNEGGSESYRLLPELLAFCKKPVYALPGNHDDPLEMREQMRKQVQCVHSTDIGPWRLLLLDSRVAGQTEGQLSDEELSRLKLWLEHGREKPTLVAVHHHPHPVGSAWMDDLCLQNGEELLTLIRQHPQVKAVTFGHTHQAFDSVVDGVRLLGTPATCFQYTPGRDDFDIDDLPPGYRWFDLHDNGQLDTGITWLGD